MRWWLGLVIGGLVSAAGSGATLAADPVVIGTRRELFVDDFLVDQLRNARLELQHPQPQEISLACDQPWEGNTCIYFRIIPEAGKYRMWYQGAQWQLDPAEPPTHPYHICYAESADGISWTKPDLGLVEIAGSKHNNVVVTGVYDNFTPFRDENPDCAPEARYKALGQSPMGLIAWQSPDGLRWTRLGDQPVIRQGAFDSQNVGFWDARERRYRAYVRDFHDGQRDIRVAYSTDFLTWTVPKLLTLSPPVAREQYYTNCIDRYARAPHLFVGFPVRYVERKWSPSMRALPDLEHRQLRARKEERIGTAITDGVFMSSRDGENFHRWNEAFLRIGPERPGAWVYGDCYPAHGLVETASKLPGAPRELSFYIAENYWRTSEVIRRWTLRLDGFVAVKAPFEGGELLTKPLVFEGKQLTLNFATSAAGSLRVELTDMAGQPVPGHTLNDCDETFGDSLDRIVTWGGKSDTSAWAGRPIRLRFELRDAELYSFQFTQ